MYEWIKALHVIAVISWMAGMLYLPRLFCSVTANFPNPSAPWQARSSREVVAPATGLWYTPKPSANQIQGARCHG
jgi:uncharacterized membrane protein